MADFDARAIRDTLLAKDVTLNPPVTEAALARLTHWACGTIHPELVQILREFDGFANDDFEAHSFLSVWPLEKSLADDWTKRPILAFSDLLLNSAIFGFDPTQDGPVVSMEDNRQVAATYRDFWQQLLTDSLDW